LFGDAREHSKKEFDMFDNLGRSIVEALYILRWLLRKGKDLVDFVIHPIILLFSMFATIGGSVVVSGWKQVRETLIRRWTQYDLAEGITKDKSRWYGIKAHAFILVGFGLIYLIVVAGFVSSLYLLAEWKGFHLIISH
jgi:hypothetical protein